MYLATKEGLVLYGVKKCVIIVANATCYRSGICGNSK